MVDPFRYTRALFDDEWPSSDTHPTDPQTIPPITGKVKDAGQIYIIIILVGWSWSLLHTPPSTHPLKEETVKELMEPVEDFLDNFPLQSLFHCEL